MAQAEPGKVAYDFGGEHLDPARDADAVTVLYGSASGPTTRGARRVRLGARPGRGFSVGQCPFASDGTLGRSI